MTTITRERLTKILIETMALIKERSSRTGDASGISTEVNASLFAEVTRMALASLTAKPVLYAAEETLAYANMGELHLTCLSEPMGDAVIPLYAAPPAPVVPDALPENDDEEGNDIDYMEPSEIYVLGRTAGWNACRDAMLQGSQPVSNRDELPPGIKPVPYLDSVAENAKSLPGNSPVIPDGYVLVPIDATREMIDAAALVEEDGYDAMHKAMIAAAPQQEVK